MPPARCTGGWSRREQLPDLVVRLARGERRGYLQVMADPSEDLRELCGLLFEARERYRAARATILHTVDAAVAEEANRHFVGWQSKQMGGLEYARLDGGEWRRVRREERQRPGRSRYGARSNRDKLPTTGRPAGW